VSGHSKVSIAPFVVSGSIHYLAKEILRHVIYCDGATELVSVPSE